MKTAVFVQARMGSSRLPGKSLRPLLARPLLGHVIDAIRHAVGSEPICVLTSEQPENDAIRQWCDNEGVICFTGHEYDVASRFDVASKTLNIDSFIRVSGDSPFIDPSTIALAKSLLEGGETFVSTVGRFPSGFHVEGLSTKVFLQGYAEFSRPSHFEHVTSFFYENRDRFPLKKLKFDESSPTPMKFSVDTSEDWRRAEALLRTLGKEPWKCSISEKCDAYIRVMGEVWKHDSE